MKKTEYKAPEMEVIKLKYQKPLLDASQDEGDGPGGGPEII